MRFAGYITVRLNSKRVPQKNISNLGGKPLVNHALSILNNTFVDDIYLCSSSDLSCFLDEDLQYTWLRRTEWSDGDYRTFNDVLGELIGEIDCDYIVYLSCTSPFCKPSTINDMMYVIRSGKHDSAFAALKHQTFSWYNNIPMNYDPNNTPRTQDIEPVYTETSGLYIFSKDLFLKTGRRIGFDPYIREVDVVEGWDIDTQKDFEIARKLWNMTN